MKEQLKCFTVIGIVLFFMSCGGDKNEVPDGVIAKDEMIELLVEIELTQALVKLNSFEEAIDEQQLYDEVFTSFNTSQDDFNNSMEFYCKDPKLLMDMYSKVIEKLTQKQSEHQRK